MWCPHCHALHWLDEKQTPSLCSHPQFKECCQNGQISLPPLSALPCIMNRLFVDDDDDAKEF